MQYMKRKIYTKGGNYMLETKEILTLEGWQKFSDKTGKLDWTSYAIPNSEIDEETYYNFLDVMPPVTMTYDYFQVGEPDSDIEVDGKLKTLFPTFCQRGNRYFYLGNCLLWERVERGK